GGRVTPGRWYDGERGCPIPGSPRDVPSAVADRWRRRGYRWDDCPQDARPRRTHHPTPDQEDRGNVRYPVAEWQLRTVGAGAGVRREGGRRPRRDRPVQEGRPVLHAGQQRVDRGPLRRALPEGGEPLPQVVWPGTGRNQVERRRATLRDREQQRGLL